LKKKTRDRSAEDAVRMDSSTPPLPLQLQETSARLSVGKPKCKQFCAFWRNHKCHVKKEDDDRIMRIRYMHHHQLFLERRPVKRNGHAAKSTAL